MSDDISKTAKGDLPAKTPRWKNPRIIGGIAVSLLVIGGLVAMANTVILWPNYSSAQLASAGSWIGGIGSIAAVSVAVISIFRAREETKRARNDARKAAKKAKEDRKAVEKRHTQQLKNANESVSRQLDAQLRSEQLTSLSGLWLEVDSIRPEFDAFWEEIAKSELVWIDRGNNTEDPSDPMYEDHKEIANTTGLRLRDAIVRTNVAFEPALLQVVEPHTQRMITAFYEDFRAVLDNLLGIIAKARKDGTTPTYVGFTQSDELLRDLQKHREPFINVTRRYLTDAEPLTSIADTSRYESHPWATRTDDLYQVVDAQTKRDWLSDDDH
ncbi:hypothetical protein HQO12_11465 [Rhodococcus fascians]|uniref:hypothetical protein n=1 Tax=Nocardiaceae TaxID=85025 RepID=UPI000B9BFE4E|nr:MULTISPECIES: hypothetical protein [Rhodococcus]MBM7242326.1 hypothetical protein [Rhodococcus fascians]MBY3809551.1 hypothetical protein [Rhodococcus fascians]MBY3840474.1 hypothetical protein [Rhodococcus fascians]MBY3845888.1 hypothetical protein [Rhodococcus fascians]MBY3849898.1 hypothetical protein [Rhodococcus fascians]